MASAPPRLLVKTLAMTFTAAATLLVIVFAVVWVMVLRASDLRRDDVGQPGGRIDRLGAALVVISRRIPIPPRS
ncbi:MAG TPA: hypothetical protein VFA27_01085 [Vicinamibacterales bacterium]|nr:hypothetical protein [Vicinamibacterales bacterium]